MASTGDALARLVAAYQARLAGVPKPRSELVVGYVGSDVPIEVLDAAGIRAVRMCGDPGAALPLADEVAERAIDGQARSELQRLLDGTYSGLDAVLVGHDTEAATRVFHYARECRHLGIGDVPPVAVVDVLHGPSPSSRRYTADVVDWLCRWASDLAGRTISDDDLAAAVDRSRSRRRLLGELRALRRQERPLLSGVDALTAIGAAATMGVTEHADALAELASAPPALTPRPGRRVFLTGSAHDHVELYAGLERAGLLVVGEDHDWGDAWFWADIDADADAAPRAALAGAYGGGAPRSGRYPVADRAAHLAAEAVAAGAEVAVAVLRRGDDGPPWDVPAQRAALAEHGIPLVSVRLDGYGLEHVESAVDAALSALERGDAGRAHRVVSRVADVPDRAAGERRQSRPARRGPVLEASRIATSYQREWFESMRDDVAAGTPLAVVNADSPHEVLRAMGVPYVVNQWWASVCAAKQQGDRYLGALAELGYPDDVEAYSAMALGSAIDADPTDAPWGGLPPVDLLVAETTTDPTAKIFEVWAERSGAALALLDATVAPLQPRRWFESIHDDWEAVLGTRRLDLMVDQIADLVRLVEKVTGRAFDEDVFAGVMALANEQAEWNARTRELIARAPRAPVGVAETIPATMIPQWHRGSEWGRDAARRLHDEVRERVDAGHGVVPDEQVRLMWVGRGLWFDMGFYERMQERHGAVFVWSMYLAVAADAYLRRGGPPVRALAARFCGFADLYNTPPWSSEWYAAEAVRNRVDGVVHLTTDAVRGTHFVTRAIEAAGVPVLEIGGSNVDVRDWDAGVVEAAVDRFVEGPALARAHRRRRQNV